MVSCSDRLQYVHSDIRGPLYLEALRMEAEGTSVLKLNTGNPGRFGYPVFIVLDKSGKVLHIQDSGYLEEGEGYNRDKVVRFFKNWTPKVVGK